MIDLFDSIEDQQLPVVDAEIFLWRRVDFGNARKLLDQLIEDTPWKSDPVTVWGKSYPQPRLVAWYGDEGKNYTYSSVAHHPLPWTATLLDLKEKVEKLCECGFNSVLLNYYRDHRDGVGFHADDEPELGRFPAIASVSFGETRCFAMKHKYRKEQKDIKLQLPSESVLLMKGATQANWKHGIPKESRPCGPRVNLTFRNILA